MEKIFDVLKIVFIVLVIAVLGVVMLFGYRDIPLEELKEKYGGPNSQYMSLGDMSIHFRDEGVKSDSIPLVLIHGTGSSLHTFDEWTEDLKLRRRVIRMDLPGYGLTGPFPHRDYSISKYVDFLSGFLEELNIDKCVLAGNSLGGRIAWAYAIDNSEHLDKLVLIDAAGYPMKSESTPIAFKLAQTPVLKNILTYITPRFVAKSSVENVFADNSKVTNEIVDRYFELTLREGNRQAFVDRFKVKGDSKASEKIKNIETETLILWGAEDLLIPVKMAYRLQEDLPNDTLVIIENSGHVPMEESPEETLEVLKSFIDERL